MYTDVHRVLYSDIYFTVICILKNKVEYCIEGLYLTAITTVYVLSDEEMLAIWNMFLSLTLRDFAIFVKQLSWM